METWEKFVRPPCWATEQIMLFFYKKIKIKLLRLSTESNTSIRAVLLFNYNRLDNIF